MNFSEAANILKNHILSLENFDFEDKQYYRYKHMGATITDAILQAGLNYKFVVFPRVKNVIEQYPEALTSTAFLDIIERYGANKVLNWQHPEKPRRVFMLTTYLVEQSIDTETDLSNWLSYSKNCTLLLCMKGIGPKTVDYLKNLVGLPSVAVDRHIRRFVFDAGIPFKNYDEIYIIVKLTADILNMPVSSLDHMIWSYKSNKEKYYQ